MGYLKDYTQLNNFVDFNSPLLALEEGRAELALFSLRVVSYVACQLVSAVRSLHTLGIAHRDIKPSNIMINPTNLNVRLIDFGGSCIAKDCQGYKLTGTRFYQAPEVKTRNLKLAYDVNDWQRADWFSLGTTIYWLLTMENYNPLLSLDENLGELLSPFLDKEAPYLKQLLNAILNVEPMSRGYEAEKLNAWCKDQKFPSSPSPSSSPFSSTATTHTTRHLPHMERKKRKKRKKGRKGS